MKKKSSDNIPQPANGGYVDLYQQIAGCVPAHPVKKPRRGQRRPAAPEEDPGYAVEWPYL